MFNPQQQAAEAPQQPYQGFPGSPQYVTQRAQIGDIGTEKPQIMAQSKVSGKQGRGRGGAQGAKK